MQSPKGQQQFGTGISKNLYALYLRKYGRSDRKLPQSSGKVRSETVSRKGPPNATSDHGSHRKHRETIRSDQSPSENIQKSTLAGSSHHERVKNKKEGVLVNKDQFQIARKEIIQRQAKDERELRGSPCTNDEQRGADISGRALY